MRSLQAELLAQGHQVSLSKLCGWLGIPRRSIYYKPKTRLRIADPALTERVKLAMQRFPTYGYRRLAIVLGENKKPIQRILQIKGWHVRKRPQGFRPRGEGAAVIDHCTREILGWRLSGSGATATAEAALEEALVSRLGHLQRVERPLMLRSDNGLVFSSRQYTTTVRAYGLTQDFITPYTPE